MPCHVSVSCSYAARLVDSSLRPEHRPRSEWNSGLAISHPPDHPGAIIRDQHRAVRKDEQADRASPHPAAVRVGAPAYDEVVIAAGRLSAAERDADDLVARPLGPVP